MLKKSLGILVVVGLFVFQGAMAAEAKVSAKSIKMMKDAQALVKVGKYADAYTLMAPYEFEKSGDVTYGHFYKFRNSLSPNSAGELTEAIFGKRSFSALHSRLAW